MPNVLYSGMPRSCRHADALVARADPVFPVVRRREVAAEAQQGRVHGFGERDLIRIEAFDGVGWHE